MSTWQHGDDGVWRVLHDAGGEPLPAMAEQVDKVRAGLASACRAD